VGRERFGGGGFLYAHGETIGGFLGRHTVTKLIGFMSVPAVERLRISGNQGFVCGAAAITHSEMGRNHG